MGEVGGMSDTDSDETIIEGSVAESDLEEEELCVKRLSLIGKDMVSTTDNNIVTEMKDINGEELSPEIQLICENSTYIEMQKHPEQIILLYSEDEKKKSPSLLQVGIISPDIATDICQSDCLPPTTVHGEGSHFICLDSEMTGFLETSGGNMTNLVVDMEEYQNEARNMDDFINEESNVLPVELFTALNSLSESVAGFVDRAVEKESVHCKGKEQLMLDQSDDCTQITDTNFKPKFHLEQHEETEVSMVTKISCHSEQELDSNQHSYELVCSDHQSIMSSVSPAEKGNLTLNETSSSKQTSQVTSDTLKKLARKRSYITTDGECATLNNHRFLERSRQKKQIYKAQTRLSAKNSESCESDLKGDPCSPLGIASSHGSLSDMNGRVEQMRKSQRIANKSKKGSKKCIKDSSFNYVSVSSINRRDIFGQTLLHRAVMKDDLVRICAVIKAGANVNAQDYAGWTALHEASLAGFFEAANELLKAGADVNCKGHEQVTPLHDAVKEGHYKVAELLLWHGADPLFKHEKGKCALEEATDKQMRKLLESYIAKSNRRSTSDSSHSKEKEIAFSSQKRNTKVTRINKANTKGETCLHFAAKKGNLSLIKSLITSGACVNQRDNAGWTAIHEASIGGFVEIISELLKAGAEVNSKSLDGVLPIHDAVSGNHFEAVQFLLDHGANPNETDNCGKNAMDEATCDKMKELLVSYGATGSKKTSRMNDVAGDRELRPFRSRKTRHCYNCYGKDNLFEHSSASSQKFGTHESISEILQDIEKKQNKLLLFELRSQSDADLYIQDLSQIQSILNEVLAKQKSERDDLAKKYRASVKSFEHGPLREQLIKLVSRQKRLLLMAQKQKELGQKVQNYKKAKKEFVSSAKQIPSMSSERNNTQDGTSDETPQCPEVAMGMESNLVMESSFLDQEQNQYTNASQHGENERTVGQNVGPHNKVSQKRLKECGIDKISGSKFSSALNQTTLTSEPAICLIHTKPSQLEETDCESGVTQRNTPSAAIPVTCTLNISETRNIGVNNINEPTTFVSINETLQQHSNTNEAYPTRTIHVESTYCCLATPQKNISPNNRTSLNSNLEFTGIVSDAQSPSRISQDFSINQDSENQSNFKPNRKKKNQLLYLLEQGKIKPGDDVLEFTFQDSKHKASLLGNGKIKTGNNTVYQNLVQWIKALLGNDIPVNRKYVWNKVTYCGTVLSKIVGEVHISKKRLEQQKPFEPPYLPSSSKQLRFLPFNEIVLIEDEELLPQHIMDQYWNLYIHCDNFGF